MTPPSPTSAATGQRAPIASVGGVVALLGRIIAAALVLVAGAAGWYGVERFELGQQASAADKVGAAPVVTLPSLGDGLPGLHLDDPEPWRQFTLSSTQGGRIEQYWFDLDKWELRTEVVTDTGTDSVEIAADRGFTLSAGTSEWVEHDPETTRNIARFVLGGVGPFVLTDLIQPGALGFTTLELEGTSRGDRVYEVVIDAPTLRQRHPLAYDRWVARTRLVPDGAGVYRIRVLPDGYVVRIDHANASVEWDDLSGGVPFASPLAIATATAPVTGPQLPLVPEVPVVPEPEQTIPTIAE